MPRDTQVDWRAMVQSAENVALSAQQEAQASRIAWIADVAITYSGLVSLNLAPRTKTFAVVDNPILAQAKVGDRIYAHRREQIMLAGLPLVGGVMIETAGYVPAAGTVEIYHVIPAVGLSQTLVIPLRLVAYRAAGA